MDDVKPGAARSLLLALGIAEALWSVIALFAAVKTTSLSGTLDNGLKYHSQITTYGYNTVGGVILVLAGAIAVMASYELYIGKATPARAAVWAVFSAVLVGSTFVSGGANVVSWLPGVPAEIQHAIGTSYVTVVETAVTNIPAVAVEVFALFYVLLAAALGLKSFT
ncbi:MAG: hypothetical protein ABH838_03845 [Actinomycetota bacterium]